MTDDRFYGGAATEEGTNGFAAMQQGAATPEPDKCPLDDAFIAIIAECRQAAQAIEAQAQGALALFLRQQGLTGRWQIAPNGRELVRTGG